MLLELSILQLASWFRNRDASPQAVRRRRGLYRSEMYWFHLGGKFRGANISLLKEAFDQVFDGYEPWSPCEHGSEDCVQAWQRGL